MNGIRKRLLVWISGVLFLIAMFTLAPDAIGESRINTVQGSVVVQPEGTSDWVEAQANYPVGTGDIIWTNNDSRAEIVGPNGVVFRMGELSSLTMNSVPQPEGAGIYNVSLPEGKLYVDAGRYAGGTVVEVSLPQALLRSSGQALYRVDSFQDGTIQVFVHRGEANLEGNFGSYRLNAGQLYNLVQGTQPQISNLPPADGFDQWNAKREDTLAGYVADNNYLPPEVASVYPDLDSYGTWTYVNDYGYSWVPRVSVGWSPFYNGRWEYWRHNPTWISYDPWGWVPHHYGRWSFSVGIGWFWVPPVRHHVSWCPGAVAWYHGPKHVYWVPLAPHELYYGRGRFGRNSVNITNINITNINYGRFRHRNYNAPNAVVEVENDRFFRGGYRTVSHRDVLARDSRKLYQSSAPVLSERAFRTAPNVVTKRTDLLPPRRIVDTPTYAAHVRGERNGVAAERGTRGGPFGTTVSREPNGNAQTSPGVIERNERRQPGRGNDAAITRSETPRTPQPFSATTPSTVGRQQERRSGTTQPGGISSEPARRYGNAPSPRNPEGTFTRGSEATRVSPGITAPVPRPTAPAPRTTTPFGQGKSAVTAPPRQEPRSMHMYTPQRPSVQPERPASVRPPESSRRYSPPARTYQGPTSSTYENRSPAYSRPSTRESVTRPSPGAGWDRRSYSAPSNRGTTGRQFDTPAIQRSGGERTTPFQSGRSTSVQQNRGTSERSVMRPETSGRSFSAPSGGSRISPSGRQQNEIGRGGRSSSSSRGNTARDR